MTAPDPDFPPDGICTRLGDFAHMDPFDPVALKGHLDAVWLKVCQGTDAEDPKWRTRAPLAVQAGLLLSGYQFGTDLHDGAAQYADFTSRLDPVVTALGIDPRAIPLMLDRERSEGSDGARQGAGVARRRDVTGAT